MGKEKKEHPSSSNMHDKALANKYSLPEDYNCGGQLMGKQRKEHPSSSNLHDKALANKYSPSEDYIVAVDS